MNITTSLLYSLLIALWPVIVNPTATQTNQTAARQTSIIPVTEAVTSSGAFVRGASNDGKRIVFESSNDYTGENKDGNNEVFVYDAELRRIIQLTKTGSQSPSGGSGGGRTLSSRGTQGRNCPGGCEPSQSAATNAVPAISSDGTRIVFASSSGLLTDTPNPDGNVELYLATLPRGATAATTQRITETDGTKDSFDNNTPAINYDGSAIAFVSTRRLFKSRGAFVFSAQNEDGNAQIYLYDVNTRSYSQVTHKRVDEGISDFEAKGFISNPCLSGNGRVLAFLSGFNFSGTAEVNNADLNGEIFIYRIGDPINQVTQVTNTTEQADVPEDGAVNVLSRFSKHLSDDGSLLVFESAGGVSPTKTGEKIRDVFIYNLNSKAFTQVTTQDVGKKDLSDYNYFPSLNGAGTYLTFSSKLNLPAVNDTAGNFDNSREIYRYDIAGSTPANPQFFLVTQMGIATDPTDQRQIILAPFASDDGAAIAFSNIGNLVAEKLSANAEVFQAVLRPALRESAQTVMLANSASFDQAAVARGSIVAAFGAELASAQAESSDTDNFPFELNGVSVTVGDALSGIAGRVISVSPTQINFIFPTGIAADDEVSFIVNNNGVISPGKVNVRDAAPGIYAIGSGGQGQASARCTRRSDDGQQTEYSDQPCLIGNDAESHSLVIYGTGWRFGSEITVRFRYTNQNGEADETEITPSYAAEYQGENGEKYLGLDQIIVTLDVDLADKINVETTVILTSNAESMTSQEQVTTSFSSFQEDMSVINAASQESGPVARGSIAVALTQNDDDESDVFTDQTITASITDPPVELGGVRVKVAGLAARILAVAPDQIRFIVPAGIEPSESVLAQVTNGVKVFNARITVQDAAPGLFTQSGEGTGTVAAKCGLALSDGTVEYSDPPCSVSTEVETRTLVLSGTGWRYASGVKVTFDNIELTPTYAGPEPGLPGVDRIELTLTQDLSGRENDIIVKATINGETASSRAGAKIAFQALDQSATPGSARLGACCRSH